MKVLFITGGGIAIHLSCQEQEDIYSFGVEPSYGRVISTLQQCCGYKQYFDMIYYFKKIIL